MEGNQKIHCTVGHVNTMRKIKIYANYKQFK